MIPEDRYEPEMQRAAEKAEESGVSVTYISGSLNVKGEDGEYYPADAVTDLETRRIVAKADDVSFEVLQ